MAKLRTDENARVFARRVGKFVIAAKLMSHQTNLVAQVLARLHFVPFKVEHLSYKDGYEFTGVSPCFELLDETAKFPKYVLEMTVDDEGVLDNLNVFIDKEYFRNKFGQLDTAVKL